MNTIVKTTLTLLLFTHAYSATAQYSTEVSPESVSCYQNGQLILKTQDRIREFRPTNSMSLILDISLGHVRENRIKLYASERAEVICVIANHK